MSALALSSVGPDLCEFDPRNLSIIFSAHAIERFRDRVRPALELHQAANELQRLLNHGKVLNRAPDWVADHQHQRAAFYLIVGDLVFPMDPNFHDRTSLRVLTCLARGGKSSAARRRANATRGRRADAGASSRAQGKRVRIGRAE